MEGFLVNVMAQRAACFPVSVCLGIEGANPSPSLW